MLEKNDTVHQLPNYEQIIDDLSTLDLDLEVSHLHGLLTGLIVAGASEQAENYLRSLILNKTGPAFHQSTHALFSIYTITHTWLNNFGFEFKMLLPDEDCLLQERILAFSDWCLGFLEGLNLAGLTLEDFESEDDIELLQHFEDFSEMDAEDLELNDEDEKAYLDVTEYARLAVLQLFCDLNQQQGTDAPAHH
jgi:uncharacterized protein YgfB (UPF0149 family)